MAYHTALPEETRRRIETGGIIEQKIWQYIRELNAFDEDHLDSTAIIDGFREYSYRQMFRKWERYAGVFSALDITGKANARVGLLGDFASEPLFAFYALNMTGASVSWMHIIDLMDSARWDQFISKEGITDLLLYADKVSPSLLRRILKTRKRLGIRSVIIFRARGQNRFERPDSAAQKALNYSSLRQVKGALFMDELLKRYSAEEISYTDNDSADDAVILHTSGTTNGIHKPIPLSDRGFNEATARLLRSEYFTGFRKKMVVLLCNEANSAFGLLDMVHLPLSAGSCVVIVPDGALNPLAMSVIHLQKRKPACASVCRNTAHNQISRLRFICQPDRIQLYSESAGTKKRMKISRSLGKSYRHACNSCRYSSNCRLSN